MDALDYALIDALAALRPDQLAQRIARAPSRAVSRPIRPWCICLRASDTRLAQADILLSDEDAPAEGRPHDVAFTSANLARLAAPVVIDWPGLDWTRAAFRLGRHEEAIRRWIARGRFKIARYNARSCSKRGKPVPYLWAPSPLDPNADEGRPPDPVWGTIWQSLHQRIPPDLDFELRRLPVNRPYPTRDDDLGRPRLRRFRGWLFICPGLPSEPSCGRLVQRLFFPLRPVTLIPHAIELGILPPTTTAPLWSHPFAPACHHCHRIRYVSLADRNGWNTFVHHISGGLLYGREVRRPPDLTITPRRRPTPRRPAPTPQRARVHALLLTDLTPAQIATRLGLKRSTVYAHAKRLYKLHGVHSRASLRAASASEWRTPASNNIRQDAAAAPSSRGSEREAGEHRHVTTSPNHPNAPGQRPDMT